MLANLFGLLMGFALLSRHFEESGVPSRLPDFLPDDWRGGFVLLVMVFVLSSFLDNIAAALIGGTVARTVFRRQGAHRLYRRAGRGGSNAGGSGSVIGDTTTTMMWIDGVSPIDVVHAYIAAGVALVAFGIPAARQQQRHAPIARARSQARGSTGARLLTVAFVLIVAIAVNVAVNLHYPALADRWPFLGAAVWAALLIAAPLRQPDWSVLPATLRGTIFLLALVLVRVHDAGRAPAAPSWMTTLVLGFVSAVFDNIPLTKLALTQGGYDWGMLAYAVGFGGSMIWFGSSAGVAITNLFPEGRSVVAWLRAGWHVTLAYVVGFAALLLTLGWQPHGP